MAVRKYKASLHIHTNDEIVDNDISYSFYEMVDFLSGKGFEVMSLTCHNKVVYCEDYIYYARSKDILLIPGVEIDIKGKHVLVLNADSNIETIKTFDGLRDYKKARKNLLIMAPHPFAPHPLFYPSYALGKELAKNIDIFDAIEWTWFYSKLINSNRKSERIAKKYGLPVAATSDIHSFDCADNCFCCIEAERKTIPAIVDAIKKGRAVNHCLPISSYKMLSIVYKYIFNG